MRLMIDGALVDDHAIEPPDAWNAWADLRPRKQCHNNPVVIGPIR